LIFIVRVPMSGFAHPLFTSLTGVGLGIAARSPSRVVRVTAPLAGLLAAMMLHGGWNLMAVLAQRNSYILLYGYVGLFVPIFLVMLAVALAARSREGLLVTRILPAYVAAGWFSPPEVAALASMSRRLSARQWARRMGGAGGHAAMVAYQAAAAELALLRDGLNRGLFRRPDSLEAALARERRLLSAVAANRAAFTGLDRSVPPSVWRGHSYAIAFPDGSTHEARPPRQPTVPVPWLLPSVQDSPGAYR
jgi:hypothetical protein